MILRKPMRGGYAVFAAISFSLVACGGDDDCECPETTVDAGDDGSGAGDAVGDVGDQSDAADASPDTAAPDTDVVEPDDITSELDSEETDGSTPGAECGNGLLEGDELCDDGNEDETDGCLADCRTTTAVTGAVRLDEFPVAGVTVTATLGEETLAATTAESDGTYVLHLPAGEWVMEASLSEFVIVTDQASLVSEGSGDAVVDFALISSNVPFDADAYGPSSFASPAVLPSLQALQFRTFDTLGDGDWFVVDTAETGPLGIFTMNLGVSTDTIIQVFDATTFVPDGTNVALNGAFGYGTEDDDVFHESLVVLPLEDAGVTEYVVNVRPFFSPCALGSYFLGTASGEQLLDADGDRSLALKDCDDSSADINPNTDEKTFTDFDDDCDGYIATRTWTDLGLGNTSRDAAHELVLDDPYASQESNILEDRLNYLTLDSIQGPDTHWYVLAVPPHRLVKFDGWNFLGDCVGDANFYWDNEVSPTPPLPGTLFRNSTDSPRRLVIQVISYLAPANGVTPAAWCILAPLFLDLGLDVDNDGIGAIGVGGRRDLDDADSTVGACDATP